MKNIFKVILLLLLLLQCNSLFSQIAGFEIVIHDDSLDVSAEKFINECNGQGYVGLIEKMTNGNLHIYSNDLYHISSEGDTLRISLAKQDTNIFYLDLIKLSYGQPGYLLSGIGYNTNSSDTNVFYVLTRFDTSYNIVWEKFYDYNSTYYGNMQMMQMTDSSFLLCCSPASAMFLLKFAYNGDSLNYRNYTGDSAGIIQSITYNPDSTAVWLHTNLAFYNGGSSINSCIEINNQLEQTKVFHYTGNNTPLPFTSILLPSGSLITGGSTIFFHKDHRNEQRYISAYKHDTAFHLQNEIFLTNPDTNARGGDVVAIDYYDPSCIYLAGTFNLQGLSGSEPSWFYVAKLNDTLGLEFEKYIGGKYYYWLLSVVATKDGGVLLTGMRNAINGPPFHNSAYIIKFDSTGCIVNLPEKNKIQIHNAIVYPNPGDERLLVQTALKNSIFTLYDLKGQKLITQPLDNRIIVINTTSLSQGIYVYNIVKDNTTIESGKWIKK